MLLRFKLRGLFFGEGNIPVERQEVSLPDAAPGSETKLELAFAQAEALSPAETKDLLARIRDKHKGQNEGKPGDGGSP